MDNCNYEIKIKMFKMLIAKSFPDYNITYFYDRESKRYNVIFNFGLSSCEMAIPPDIIWDELKEDLEMMVNIPLFTDNKCYICSEEIQRDEAYLCDDCELDEYYEALKFYDEN